MITISGKSYAVETVVILPTILHHLLSTYILTPFSIPVPCLTEEITSIILGQLFMRVFASASFFLPDIVFKYKIYYLYLHAHICKIEQQNLSFVAAKTIFMSRSLPQPLWCSSGTASFSAMWRGWKKTVATPDLSWKLWVVSNCLLDVEFIARISLVNWLFVYLNSFVFWEVSF